MIDESSDTIKNLYTLDYVFSTCITVTTDDMKHKRFNIDPSTLYQTLSENMHHIKLDSENMQNYEIESDLTRAFAFLEQYKNLLNSIEKVLSDDQINALINEGVLRRN